MIHRSRPLILAASVLSLLAPKGSAEILGEYNFGQTTPGVLTPANVAEGIAASSIIKGSGLSFDLSSPLAGSSPVATAPFLRVTTIGTSQTAEEAALNDAGFTFTLSAIPGFVMELTSLNFDAWKGGTSGARGYGVQTSADNFDSIVTSAVLDNVRGAAANVNVDLTGATYQNLSGITLKLLAFAESSAQSVEFDNIKVNGSATFNGLTWQGGTGSWDTSSTNWSGPSTTYTVGGNVLFNDTASTGAVNVASTGLNPEIMTFTNSEARDYSFTGNSVVAAQIYKAGNGTVTFNNEVSAGSVTVASGKITVGATGTLTSTDLVVAQNNTLEVVSGGKLGNSSIVTVDGVLNLSNGTQKLAGLNGASTGAVNLNDTDLEVTGTSTYAGKINGDGALTKSTGGVLTLTAANTYTGGTTITGGTLRLNNVSSAGSGVIAVKSGGSLVLAAGVGNDITLDGGTIGVNGNITIPSTATVTVSKSSTVNTFNPVTGANTGDLIVNGTLTGSGDITLDSINGNSPDNSAFRLRGPASNYTGNITVNKSAKFELQTDQASGSPMGTGKLVMKAGDMTNSGSGTFSLINVRNNALVDTTFGNDVEIEGVGGAYFNMVNTVAGANGTTTYFGNLKIGDGQTVAAVSTASTVQTVGFNSVTLTGGVATFAPRPVGNTVYIGSESIRLGKITEQVPGSGIAMNGEATLTLAGQNEYTGPTDMYSGTLVIEGSIESSTLYQFAGTVKGSGKAGTVEVMGGILAPGDGIGTLTVDDLTFYSGTLSIEIGGTSSYDQLVVNDGLAFNAQVALSLDFSQYDPVAGDEFRIFDNRFDGGITFGGLDTRLYFGGVALDEGAVFTATSGGRTRTFEISYAGGDGNDIVLSTIPEPGTATALLLGAAMLGARRRRR